MMNTTTNPGSDLEQLRAHIGTLAVRAEELRAILLSARDESVRHAHELQDALQEVRASGNARPKPAAPGRPTEAANKFLAYQQLIGRVREVVHSSVPSGATVIVISRGDEELMKLQGRTAWHFPRNAQGEYAGYYPADSAAAIEHLEALRAAGGEFLVLPQTASWWLDYYVAFKQHLEKNYRLVCERPDICSIWALDASAPGRQPLPPRKPRRLKPLSSKNGNGKHGR